MEQRGWYVPPPARPEDIQALMGQIQPMLQGAPVPAGAQA